MKVTLALALVASGVLCACSGADGGVSGQNVYEKLAEGGIYCSDERIDQPKSYVERPDGTTESASPYPWTLAGCDTGDYSFTVQMYDAPEDLAQALSECVVGAAEGFVSRGPAWVAYGGLQSLDRRAADGISKALAGETVAIADVCVKPHEEARPAMPVDREALVEGLMAEIGDESMPEGSRDCIKQGLGEFSTEELITLRDGEGDTDVPVELQDKVVSMVTECITS